MGCKQSSLIEPLINKYDGKTEKCNIVTNKDETEDLHHTADLTNNSFSNLKKFTYDGKITKCKVVDVYDGDTVTIVFYDNNRPIKDSFRMFGYDAPEIKPLKTTPNREIHISAAKRSKQELQNLTKDKILWVKFCSEEKYGRLMGYLYFDSPMNNSSAMSINNHMMEHGFGKTYNGEKKHEFTFTELNAIIIK